MMPMVQPVQPPPRPVIIVTNGNNNQRQPTIFNAQGQAVTPGMPGYIQPGMQGGYGMNGFGGRLY